MPSEYDGVSPRVNLGEKSPYKRENISQVVFGVGTLPWHMVECPKCEGRGEIIILRSISHEMAIDAGEPEMEGQPIGEALQCDLCDGEGEVRAFRAKKWMKSQQDIS